MRFRRISWIIGLDYGTTIDQLRDVREGIEAYILGSEDFVHPPETVAFVRVDKFNDLSIDLMVYCFTRTTDWGDWLKIKEELAYAIKTIVTKAGSRFRLPKPVALRGDDPNRDRAVSSQYGANQRSDEWDAAREQGCS